MDSTHENEHTLVPLRVYFVVYAALIVLTTLTVGVSMIDLKKVTVLMAMIIATCKATLVLMYFMHIRYEKPMYVAMIAAILATYGVFIGLTFTDYWYR